MHGTCMHTFDNMVHILSIPNIIYMKLYYEIVQSMVQLQKSLENCTSKYRQKQKYNMNSNIYLGFKIYILQLLYLHILIF